MKESLPPRAAADPLYGIDASRLQPVCVRLYLEQLGVHLLEDHIHDGPPAQPLELEMMVMVGEKDPFRAERLPRLRERPAQALHPFHAREVLILRVRIGDGGASIDVKLLCDLPGALEDFIRVLVSRAGLQSRIVQRSPHILRRDRAKPGELDGAIADAPNGARCCGEAARIAKERPDGPELGCDVFRLHHDLPRPYGAPAGEESL